MKCMQERNHLLKFQKYFVRIENNKTLQSYLQFLLEEGNMGILKLMITLNARLQHGAKMAGYGCFTNLIQKSTILNQFSNLLLCKIIVFLYSAESWRDAVDDGIAEFQKDAINSAWFRCFVDSDRKWAQMCHLAVLSWGLGIERALDKAPEGVLSTSLLGNWNFQKDDK